MSKALTSLKSKGNLLEDIAWSRDVEERFFAAKCGQLPEPEYAIDHDALEDESARLERLARSIEGDEPIPTYLRSAVRSAVDRNRLLTSVGTKAFGDVSREIYGGARTASWGDPDGAHCPRNVDLADHLLERLRVHGWDEARDTRTRKQSATQLAAVLEERIRAHRPKIDVDVILDERCTSKAIAGMKRVRIRPDATFESWKYFGIDGQPAAILFDRDGVARPTLPFPDLVRPRWSLWFFDRYLEPPIYWRRLTQGKVS